MGIIPSALFPNFLFFLMLFSICQLLSNCKKKTDLEDKPIVKENTIKPPPIAPYLFNWETATYMPSPAPGNQIQMPWNSGTTAIDPNIVSDYRSADGWVMVWYTFSPTTVLPEQLLQC